jgi:hypothetical protein
MLHQTWSRNLSRKLSQVTLCMPAFSQFSLWFFWSKHWPLVDSELFSASYFSTISSYPFQYHHQRHLICSPFKSSQVWYAIPSEGENFSRGRDIARKAPHHKSFLSICKAAIQRVSQRVRGCTPGWYLLLHRDWFSRECDQQINSDLQFSQWRVHLKK